MAGKRKRQGAIDAAQTVDQRQQDLREMGRRERRRRRVREEDMETIRLLRERVRSRRRGREEEKEGGTGVTFSFL